MASRPNDVPTLGIAPPPAPRTRPLRAGSLRLYLHLVGEAAQSWLHDRGPSMGAALAFYSAFSLAPLLLIVINIAGVVFGDASARHIVADQFRGLIGPVGADAIEGMLEATAHFGTSPLSVAIGLVVLFIGATTVLVELQDDLDIIWEAPVRDSGGIFAIVRARFLSFALILGFGFLLLVSLVATSALALLRGYWGALPPAGWVEVIDFVLSIAVFTVLFAMLFKWLPSVKIKWKDVWEGAVTTSVLFHLGSLGIGTYLGHAATTSIYAAAASFSILLLWLYYSAQIFLFGAEVTWVRARYRERTSRGGIAGNAASESGLGAAASVI